MYLRRPRLGTSLIVVFERAAKKTGIGYKILGWIDGADVYLFDILYEGTVGSHTRSQYCQWLGVLLFQHLTTTTASHWDAAKSFILNNNVST